MGPSPTALHFPAPVRILLVTNLLDLDTVLPLALRYALRTRAQLKLLHALSGPDESLRGSFPSWTSRFEERKTHAELVLRSATLQAQHAGIDCTWALHDGDISCALAEVEDAWAPDRIIVARQEMETEWEALDPAVELILREASVPVLVVGPNVNSADWMPDGRKLRILFATSLDREARDVAELVLRFTRNHQAELTMLHVIDRQSARDAWLSRVRQYAKQRFSEIAGNFPAGEVLYLIRHGRVAETLLRIAKTQNFDFVLIGFVSGAAFRTDILPGSAYKIVCEAPCPVLVLKREPSCLPSGVRGFEAEITTPYPALSGKILQEDAAPSR
jgi:nucleotide-binding universal stress UspA family protein